MAGFSPGVVEKSSETVVEQPPLASPLTRVSHQALLLSRRYAKEVQGVPDAHEVTNAVQGVGMLPGSLRLRQFRRGVLPAFTRPRGVSTAHEAKRIPLPPGPGQLRLEIAHNRGIRREIWGRQGRRRRCPDGGTIQVLLQPSLRRILITVRHKVPVLPLHQHGKESTGILASDDLGMLGESEEGQPIAVTLPDQALRLGLLKEGEESRGVLQIFGYDVTKCWGLSAGLLALFLVLFCNTSRASAGGGGCVLERWGGCGCVRP